MASLVRGDPWSIMWKDRCFIQEDGQDPRRGVHWADKGWVIQPPEGRGGRHNCREYQHRAPPGHSHLPNPEEDVGMPLSQSLLFGLFFQSMNDTYHQKCSFCPTPHLPWITKRAAGFRGQEIQRPEQDSGQGAWSELLILRSMQMRDFLAGLPEWIRQ